MTAQSRDGASASIVIPCYNAERWIARAIDSALAQDPAAVIVIDDGSSDASLEVIRGFGDRITWRTGPNRGGNAARNAGLALTETDYVVFLDADDYLEGEMLRASIDEAQSHGADIVLSAMRIERADGTETLSEHYLGDVDPHVFFEGWLRGRYVNPSATLWRTAFVRRIGWDESLARAQDADTMLRALLDTPRIRGHRRGRGVYTREAVGSVSRTESRTAIDSRLRVITRLLDRVAGGPFEQHLPALQWELYRIARAAFVAGELDLGRAALARLKASGHRGHPGTMRHRLLASLIGLEWKTRIWGR